MNYKNFLDIIACPRCKTPIKNLRNLERCKKCKFIYKKTHGIWNLFYSPTKESLFSQKGYENIHSHRSGRINDESYEILASMAKGNRTIDIACGDGYIEKLAPTTIGVDFSFNALLKAKKNGVRYLLQANAEYLPFKENAFELAICAGSLEHFFNPLRALMEMARVSRVQILTVHRTYPIPFANIFRKLLLIIFGLSNQPIDNPISGAKLGSMLKYAKLTPVFKGVWTYPFDFGILGFQIPNFLRIPSCHFVITVAK